MSPSALRRLPLLVSVLGCGVLISRVPSLAREGGHRRSLAALLDHPLPTELDPGSLTPGRGGQALVYLYSEVCPYCAMDRQVVQHAASQPSVTSAAFIAVHLGPAGVGSNYWRSEGLRTPDTLLVLSTTLAQELGVNGVPVLAVVEQGTVTAAWQGKLRWRRERLAVAVKCELGSRSACLKLTLLDAGSAFVDRILMIAGHAIDVGQTTDIADGVPIDSPLGAPPH